jgi:hypothetical protein
LDCVKKHYLSGANVIAKALIQAVDQKKKPKQDNTTVQVIAIPDFIGTSGGFSVKGYFIALFIALILGCIGAYVYFTSTVGAAKFWSELFDSGAKPVPVPISIVPAPSSSSESISPSISIAPSAPGLGETSIQKSDSETIKKQKNEKRDSASSKPSLVKPKAEAEIKNGDNSKPKDGKPSPAEPNGKAGSDSAEPSKEDVIRKLFGTPDPSPTPAPSKKAPESETPKLLDA